MTKITPGLLIAALMAVLSMSLVPILIRSASANEVTIGIARLAIALVLLSPVIFFRQSLQLSVKAWLNLALVGIVFGAHWLSYFVSIKMASASMAASSDTRQIASWPVTLRSKVASSPSPMYFRISPPWATMGPAMQSR